MDYSIVLYVIGNTAFWDKNYTTHQLVTMGWYITAMPPPILSYKQYSELYSNQQLIMDVPTA